jgi:hypothetical protein
MSQDTVSPHELERLQIRAIAFSDRVDELLAIFSNNDECEPPARNDCHLTSDADAASQALAEILQLEASRVKIPIPDWFGPKEQLSNWVAFNGDALFEAAGRLISEIETHDGHSYPCRCAELQDVLVGRFQPAFDEWNDLIKAIEELIHRERSHPGGESPSG